MTKQRTANIKMSRIVGVVWLVNPILIILHTVKSAEVLRQEVHGSYRSIRQSYQKTYLNCVQFFVRMCLRLCEYVHISANTSLKTCQIPLGAKFGKKHMAATGV